MHNGLPQFQTEEGILCDLAIPHQDHDIPYFAMMLKDARAAWEAMRQFDNWRSIGLHVLGRGVARTVPLYRREAADALLRDKKMVTVGGRLSIGPAGIAAFSALVDSARVKAVRVPYEGDAALARWELVEP